MTIGAPTDPPAGSSDPPASGSPGTPGRTRQIVTAVVAEAVREAGAAGVVLDGEGPERALLASWLGGTGGLLLPDDGDGRALVASTRTKTLLLLTRTVPLAHLFPLGDVWASRVEAWTGDASRPAWLREEGPDLGAVDEALRRWTEGEARLSTALSSFSPPVRRRLERLLQPPLACGRPPIVPKLTGWTPWVDPPL